MEKNKNQYLSIFSSEGYFSNVFKKAEKITAALYLVTNLFPASEPLKEHLRRQGLKVVSSLSASSTALVSEEGTSGRAIIAAIAEVMSLLTVARTAGLVSEMNGAILNREYAKLFELVESEIPAQGGRRFVFSSDFFTLDEEPPKPSAEVLRDEIVERLIENPQQEIGSKGHIKDIKNIKRQNSSLSIKDSSRQRRDLILKIAAEKGKITIKDVSHSIGGVSEKTVQREVLTLVEEGVLKKEGERRWSRYFLA